MADPESLTVGCRVYQHRLRTTQSRCKVRSMALVMEPVSKWTTGQVVNWMKGRKDARAHTHALMMMIMTESIRMTGREKRWRCVCARIWHLMIGGR